MLKIMKGQPFKNHFFLKDISGTVKNSLTLVKQNLFETTTAFIWHQEKGTHFKLGAS